MRRILIAILLLGLCVPAISRDKFKSDEYKGKVYKEIRVDDRGIFLIDSLGNETEVQTSGDREGPEPTPQLSLLPGNIDLPPGFYTDTITGINKIGGSIIVETSDYVDGSVVVVGNATIKGRVSGSVTATGKVTVAATGVVGGNVTGSKVSIDPSAQVIGRVSVQRISIPFSEGEWPGRNRTDPSTPAVVGLILISLQLAIAVGIINIFQRPAERLRAVFHANIFKALVVGFLFEIMLPVIWIVLIITIIGIPVALIALPLAVIAAGFLGFASFCMYLSDFIRSKSAVAAESRFHQVLIGFAILQVPWLGFFLGFVIDSEAMSIVFGIIAGILFFIVTTASLGATILTRFGTRLQRDRLEPGNNSSAVMTTVSEKVAAPEVKSVDARIIMAAGHFRLTRGAGGGVIATLAGNYDRERFSYDYGFTPRGDRGEFRFSTETLGNMGLSNFEGRQNDWQIEFDSEIDLQLKTTIGAAKCEIDAGDLTLSRFEVEIGAADAKIDFSVRNRTNLSDFKVEAGACKLQMTNIGNSRFRLLEFDGGVGKFVLDFGGQFDYRAEARVDIGMGALTVIIPPGLGVQLRADAKWLSSLDLSKSRLVAVAGKGLYETENFESAQGQLILILDVGLGSAKIEFR